MFAVVSIAGTQEMVEKGQTLHVPLLSEKEGNSVTFNDVYLLSKGKGSVTVGTPTVSGAYVEAKILSHGKDKKITVFKMKRRKRYRRTQGHRQGFSEIEITNIMEGGSQKAETKEIAPTKKKAATTRTVTAKKKTPAKKVPKED